MCDCGLQLFQQIILLDFNVFDFEYDCEFIQVRIVSLPIFWLYIFGETSSNDI